MRFDAFIHQLEHLKSTQLGGLEAQFKLAPRLRLGYDAEKIKARNPKKAAVLALFYPNKNGETTFLLTQRAQYKGTHSAQISFPGGKTEKQDKTLFQTALREAYEEVGVATKEIIKIREMTDVYIPPSNFLATPFIAYTQSRPQFKTNEEVDELIEVTVSDLLDDSNVDTVIMNTSYMEHVEVPCFRLNQYIVWPRAWCSGVAPSLR